jgi:CelD/BcsL family acetyltransferase involved in cellulose biosynthesis
MKFQSKETPPYQVEINDSYDIERLEKDWRRIEADHEVPFFLTWTWISCWLKTYKPKIILVTASINQKPVCIGLFTKSTQKRRGFITSRQIRLHQMGDPLKDQIWMEYNDFICEHKYQASAVHACLSALDNDRHWDEIILSMMTATRALEVSSQNNHAVLDMYRPSYSVNLENIRKSNKTYLDFLTSNTRYQINRSIRLYENEYGKISLIVAETTQQALDFFHQAGPFHLKRWKDSGYTNHQFIVFHENLIQQSFDRNNISLLKIQAGDETIAIMYYHLVNKTVYFYLHGLKYESNKKLKPGLVAHTVATQYFHDLGMEKYDYMGGYSQYKEQLADLSEKLVTVIIQRPRSRFKFEKMARDIKNRMAPQSS